MIATDRRRMLDDLANEFTGDEIRHNIEAIARDAGLTLEERNYLLSGSLGHPEEKDRLEAAAIRTAKLRARIPYDREMLALRLKKVLQSAAARRRRSPLPARMVFVVTVGLLLFIVVAIVVVIVATVL